MRVEGILETALYVSDPAMTAAFYRRLFGFGTLLESDRLVALDVAGKNVLLLFRGGPTGEPFRTPGGVSQPAAYATQTIRLNGLLSFRGAETPAAPVHP